MIGQIQENTDVLRFSFSLTHLAESPSRTVARGSPEPINSPPLKEGMQISLQARVMQLRSQSASGTMPEGNLGFSLSARVAVRVTPPSPQKARGVDEVSLDPQLAKDLKLILRMLARDDREYKELEKRFEGLLGSFEKSMKGMGPSDLAVAVPAGSGVESFELQLSVSIKVKMKASVNSMVPVSVQAVIETGAVDPLVLDLDGDGPEISSVETGVFFDILGSGRKVRTSSVLPDDGLLVLDRNGNGFIDSGLELIGDRNGASHGFEELSWMDDDGNGVIDRRDSVFDKLQVYRDLNRDGISQGNELFSLTKINIASIDLAFARSSSVVNGNAIAYTGSFTLSDGTRRSIAEAYLNFVA